MKDRTIAILESRAQDQMAALVRKQGGTPFLAPALAETPDVDPAHLQELITVWQSAPPHVFVFQTGVGTRALFAATDSLGLSDVLLRLLDGALVVVRGPKPTTVLRSRKVRIDVAAATPFTTHEVLAAMQAVPLRGKRVAVQRYGETNRELQGALASAGAEVIEIVTYRWSLPADTAPLLRLIEALDRDEIDLVAFTSASQAPPFRRCAAGGPGGVAQAEPGANAGCLDRTRLQLHPRQARRQGRHGSPAAEARPADACNQC